jgi:hypothetical protein
MYVCMYVFLSPFQFGLVLDKWQMAYGMMAIDCLSVSAHLCITAYIYICIVMYIYIYICIYTCVQYLTFICG